MSLWGRVFRERRGVVLPLLVLAAISVGALVLGIYPMSRHVAGLETEATDADLALKLARADAEKAKGERSSKERAEVDLQKFYADVLPTTFVRANDVANNFMSEAARETGLQYFGGQFRPARVDDVKKTRLTKLTGKITLKGDYNAVRRFLYRVETAEEFVIVEEVNLNQPGTAGTGQSLELELTVATYYLSETPGVERR